MKKTFLVILMALLPISFVQAEPDALWQGTGYHFNKKGKLMDVFSINIQVSEINANQKIQLIEKVFADGTVKQRECLITEEKESRRQKRIHRECDNGAGELVCLGRLCEGAYETDNGEYIDVSATVDKDLVRTFSSSDEGIDGVFSSRSIVRKIQ